MIWSLSLAEPPGPPTQPQLASTSTKGVSISWNPPEDDGGAPVTAYAVEMCVQGEKRWQSMAANVIECSFSVDGLLTDKLYQFRVFAINSAGKGKPSMPSDGMGISE